MITVADTGPLLHLFWVDALAWALPPGPIDVVDTVWREVERHEQDVLKDVRLRRVTAPTLLPPELAAKNLDSGEEAALSYALAQTGEDVLVLCDEIRARKACGALSLPVIGSIGLIVRAFQDGRVSQQMAVTALRDLPTRGLLYVRESLLDDAVAQINSAELHHP